MILIMMVVMVIMMKAVIAMICDSFDGESTPAIFCYLCQLIIKDNTILVR